MPDVVSLMRQEIGRLEERNADLKQIVRDVAGWMYHWVCNDQCYDSGLRDRIQVAASGADSSLPTYSQVLAENARLRARVAELEAKAGRDLSRRQAAAAAMREAAARLVAPKCRSIGPAAVELQTNLAAAVRALPLPGEAVIGVDPATPGAERTSRVMMLQNFDGTTTMADAETGSLRCPVCGWPLKATAAEGCVPGNCSQRPKPRYPDAGTTFDPVPTGQVLTVATRPPEQTTRNQYVQLPGEADAPHIVEAQ